MSAKPHGRGQNLVWRNAVSYALMSILGLLMVTPFLWMVVTSLHPSQGALPDPSNWIPRQWHWENYRTVVTMPETPFLRFLMNTVIVCVSVVLGSLLFCSMAAYGFARTEFRGRDTLFYMFLATMMVPGAVTMIPVFLIIRYLGWLDTYYALIVPGLSGAFGIFLLRQFFRSVPNELSESARIDGATELGIYARVILPLSKPALATVALFTFIGGWTDFMGPLLYLNDPNKYTLSLGLQQFVSQHGAEWSMLMAASTVMALPIVILYFAAQRTFVEGITLTGIKG